MSLKGFLNHFSHNYHIDIDSDVLSGHCTSSSVFQLWSVARFTCTSEIWHIYITIPPQPSQLQSCPLQQTITTCWTTDLPKIMDIYGILHFLRNLFFTKMCIIRNITRNIHTQQIIFLVTFHVLTIIDLSRTSILINQNYS